MSHSRKEFISNFFLVIGYAAVFFTVQYILFKTCVFATCPDADSLLAWDAGWYYSIAHGGYQYWEAANNTGFYFLFPAVWYLSHLDALGVSCVNIVFFALGFALFCNIYKPSTGNKLLLLSVPSIFFMFVPYAEAIFFLLSALCFYGIVHGKRYIIWISLFFLALTRANAAVFFPVFLFSELLCQDRKIWYRTLATVLYTYGLPLVAGTAAFILYQYYATGVWFAYFKVQSTYWNREFNIPTFPLGSYLGSGVLWLNALALFTGLIAAIVLVKDGVLWMFHNRVKTDKLLLVSQLYLAAVLFLILFFNPTWDINATNVFGAHRYAFAGPFIMVFMLHYGNGRTYMPRDYLLIFLLANAFWLLFGSYLHIQSFLYFNFVSLLVLFFMFYANKKLRWPLFVLLAINILFQLLIFQQFISHVFID